ncbi:sugar phosphate isomerase/epimerase family protein [Streptosporangium sp. NPDC001559]|uniref:sugar phosphate isomerase/epimerase family protein n=1 Tax=Streptosporangium sp. NPDC001559 TaxID=3366187 RepID=UPI0036E56D0E
MSVTRASTAKIALSTASVYPERTPDAFELAARLGYDGVEIMVGADPVSQDVDVLERLSDHYQLPILAIHAPCLLVTQRVWGKDPWVKLQRAQRAAERVGARTVVVHPPFRWQRDYAREFEVGLARMRDETDVVFAVENMFPLKARGNEVVPYSPGWNPIDYDFPQVTLDLSHTAVSGTDAREMFSKLGDRLAHLHLADGLGVANKDEHLVPGRGNQPCAEILERMAGNGYDGLVVLEINTRKAGGRTERIDDLAEALAFARRHLAPSHASGAKGSGTAGSKG